MDHILGTPRNMVCFIRKRKSDKYADKLTVLW